jgi:hypothetical protein
MAVFSRCNVVTEGDTATISRLKTIKETTSLQNGEHMGSIASMVGTSGVAIGTWYIPV